MIFSGKEADFLFGIWMPKNQKLDTLNYVLNRKCKKWAMNKLSIVCRVISLLEASVKLASIEFPLSWFFLSLYFR